MINPRQVRILVVDDEREIRDLLAARFTIFGFQTQTATSGEEAWQAICGDSSIKIVVTDLHMPGGSGLDLLAKIKQAHPEFPKVFAISGQAHFSPEEFLALGAEGFIHKPFDARALLNTVRNALLTIEERLRYPSYVTPTATVSVSHSSLDEAFKSGEFAMGRGGCFLTSAQNFPPEGHLLAFEIHCGEFHLTGAGFVRWRRVLENKFYGAGVEFVHLSTESIKALKTWQDGAVLTSFIPSPQIRISMPSIAKLQSTG